jgi:hypothetical protein
LTERTLSAPAQGIAHPKRGSINLMIGATSLLRGVPGVPNLLLRSMPAGQAVAKFDRAWMALALTAQAFFGVVAGILV